MPHLEIEKRYLVKSAPVKKILKNDFVEYKTVKLEQFYLVANIDETLRYRKEGNIYIKNSKRGSGLVREESEVQVSRSEYLNAKRKNSGGVIKKQRVVFELNDYRFELDIFKGALRGLRILEIEFATLEEAQSFTMPQLLKPLIIKEITNETIYSNGALSKSMQIPLRADSFIALRDFLQKKEFNEVGYNLYISEYENAKLAFDNSIKSLLAQFKYQIEQFQKNGSIQNLKVANRALSHMRSLIKSYRRYIQSDSYEEILFNIDRFLLLFEEVLQLHKSFVQLLKAKEKFELNLQTRVLKLLVDIAKKQKVKRDRLLKINLSNIYSELESRLSTTTYSKALNKPFEYINYKLLRKKRTKLQTSLKKEQDFEAAFLQLKEYKHLLQFSKKDDRIAKYAALKRFIQKEHTRQIVESFNSSIATLFDRYSHGKKRLKPLLKRVVRSL